MDAASQVLALDLPADVSTTYAALAERGHVPLSTLHHRAHGRASKEVKAQRQQYLTPEEEKGLVNYILLMSNLGHPVRIKHVPNLALSIAQQRSAPHSPPKAPGKNWARAFEKRHPELKARKVRAIDWKRHENNIYHKITHWFGVIGTVLQDRDILPENVYNMDETGVMLSMLGTVKVLLGKHDARDYRGAGVKRTMVTAIECISADGRSLLPLIIWPASTHRSNWTTYPTPGWHYAHSENGYNDSWISLEWLRRVFDDQTRARANHKPRVLICDGFGTHGTLEVMEYCFANNIILCRLPSHTSHKLQPCDVGVFGPLKTAYRDQVERLNRGGLATIGKEHFTSLYCPARTMALTKRNIMAGWAATGLFPSNPDRVLRHTPQPAETSIARELEVPPGLGDGLLRTPTTPVTAEGLALLCNMIKQDSHTLEDKSRGDLQRHVQKLASAAKMSLAEKALLHDQNRFLFAENGKAKIRRATRSLVLGEAKVMSYKDLYEARMKRAAKDEANEGKQKRRRQRRSLTPEPHGEEGQTSAIELATSLGTTIQPESFQAPIARMVE